MIIVFILIKDRDGATNSYSFIFKVKILLIPDRIFLVDTLIGMKAHSWCTYLSKNISSLLQYFYREFPDFSKIFVAVSNLLGCVVDALPKEYARGVPKYPIQMFLKI